MKKIIQCLFFLIIVMDQAFAQESQGPTYFDLKENKWMIDTSSELDTNFVQTDTIIPYMNLTGSFRKQGSIFLDDHQFWYGEHKTMKCYWDSPAPLHTIYYHGEKIAVSHRNGVTVIYHHDHKMYVFKRPASFDFLDFIKENTENGILKPKNKLRYQGKKIKLRETKSILFSS